MGENPSAKGFYPTITSALADQFLFLIWKSKGRRPFAERFSPTVACR
ncbi:MAG: hypothetical protein LBU34_12070 [Planctomycetaceae bacterium]|nr:hypothetical protein [Planctomycetaceae bacterium]